MNLVSCNECGVVLNKDQLAFPEIWSEEGVDDQNSIWNGEDYIATVPCPVCNNKIPEKE